jgi:hypothetical protein
MSDSGGKITSADIFGDDSSVSISSDEEAPLDSAQGSSRGAGMAPVKRMRLSMKQKMAAIKG